MAPDDIHFPPYQGHCVKLSVINGAKAHMATQMLVHPVPDGQKYMNLACYSFLIESPHRNQKVLFDLAFMKDLDARMPPSLKALFAGDEHVMGIDEFHHIPDTIKAHGIELSAINAVIWSHAHIDHVGDPSVFPPSTELVVGPGLKARCIPGHPTNPDSFVLDSAFQGRSVREVDFSTSATTINGFRAVDFFEDGSFWLLEASGHTEDHICALCRTTEESWVLLGGDACHTIAQLRPNRFRPLPNYVPASTLGRTPPPERCSCAHMSRLVQQAKGGSFYDLAPGMQEDLKRAEETIEKLKAFDGRDDVMVVIAHDASWLDVLDFFPQNINDWKAAGWAVQGRWLFLRELEGLAAASS
ncbi:hypothetical protein EPUS_09475 [Endocarpon pusillum Z07020]|uniref:Metallo-beta-lactamase domain-containing protein n=1 Tax=Endocarpon pusillum (strain Z07020 / HMAS-L-300199) TaxID=1263415 RepID=U1HF21_ENDPU|nr:uncharacterized protein EPUS_09475 [Endocarpon pusillum Z07020]ERF68650.1 hypothetical protein EPUS_09475 [Endocarpon pusillum Z07020]